MARNADSDFMPEAEQLLAGEAPIERYVALIGLVALLGLGIVRVGFSGIIIRPAR